MFCRNPLFFFVFTVSYLLILYYILKLYSRAFCVIYSGSCEVMVLLRQDAISRWRTLIGPTRVFKTARSHPDTVRGMFGLTDTRNTAHGSGKLIS